MAPFLLLLILLSEAASGLIVVTVLPGQDVILPCQAAGSSISAVKWRRPDLKPDTVLLYSDGHLNTDNQNPSFKGRVELVERDLKDGNMSLTLKNVRRHDAGTYECRVKTGDTDPIRLIRLQVKDLFEVTVRPGDDVILQCWAADSSISVVEWSRPDLRPDIVLYYSDGHLNTDVQHPSFLDRVELRDRDLKDRDVSLILKNVNKHDTGTYACRVITGDSEPITTIRIISLQVPEPAGPVGLIVGLTVILLLLLTVAVVAVVGVWKRQRQRRDEKRTVVMVVPRLRGEKAILRCQADDSSISAVEWSRADLKPDTILSYRDKWSVPSYPHPDYKEDKVDLVDRDLKKGNMSLVLWNVIPNDQGTYECRVTSRGSRWKNIPFLRSEPIRIIHLQVREQNLIEVTVHPGDDATLPCQAANPSISDVEWSRADLKPDTILSYRVEGSVLTNLHPKYKEDKVQLEDKDLKKGNMSLILKNVSRDDQGTYKCRVTSRGSMWTNSPVLPWETTTIIRLQVIDPADLIEVTVHPGDDVILPFKADHSSISIVEWTRPDLEPDTVLLYIHRNLYTIHQHPSFKDRVELVDRWTEDGDVSLILKNVNRHDAGTYKCRVTVAGSERNDDSTSDPITFIRLQVADLIEVVRPGDDALLQCRAADSSISFVMWSKPDLGQCVFLYRDEILDPYNQQHPFFKGRVEMMGIHRKDGDVSLTLKNVSRHDAGRYECRVKTLDSEKVGIIGIISLQVPDAIVEVHAGDNATLPCQTDDSSIRAVEWSRTDQKPDNAFLYRDDRNERFKSRVDRDPKTGDVSLILKNVNIYHTGTYECRVITVVGFKDRNRDIDSEPIRILRIIRLQVREPDEIVVVRPGDNAILPCKVADPSINDIKWTRPDKHPSFKDRVYLVNRDLNDRDVSLTLENVSRHDAGIYECRVNTGGSKLKKIDSEPIRTVRLQVADEIVRVRPGDKAILPCQVADPSINDVKWTRPDKHPSFKGRVYLVNRDLNDRDASLTLENVSRHDAGTYECRVNTGGSKLDSEPIRTVYLQVADESVVNNETDDRNGTKEDINSDSLINIPLLNHPSAGYRASRSREDRNSSHVV